MAFLDENGVAQLWDAVKDRLAGAFDSVEFDVAKQAANLVSGDSIATAFGKLAKNYSSILTSISDLNTNLTNQINTKLNKSDVLANYTTTATGKALDASLGPAIKTKMDLADTLNTKVTNLTSKTNSYIIATAFDIPGADLTNGFSLASYVEARIQSGYEFLCWFPCVLSVGFVSSVPAYVGAPTTKFGGFYCNNINKGTSASYKFTFLQRKVNT